MSDNQSENSATWGVETSSTQVPVVVTAEPVTEELRRKMERFRRALHQIVALLDELTDDEQKDILRNCHDCPHKS